MNSALSMSGALVALVFPFLAFALALILFKPKWTVWLHGMGAIGAFVYVFFSSNFSHSFFTYNWLKSGSLTLDLGLAHFQETGFLVALVGLVGFLVVLFSVQYMAEAKSVSRYFSELSLFIFAMQVLLFAPSAFQFFIGWELMGLCSFLLIGHYRAKKSAQEAATKAWMYNRIGDAGFIAGLGLMIYMAGSTDFVKYQTLFEASQLPIKTLTIIGFCWIIAAVGKSAQFPLLGWLPDAMAGPTPVSALIHAATMVVAGVVLLIRMFPTLSSMHLMVLMYLGGITAIWGAIQAIRSTELKRLLAWSTVSQLGWLVMTLGAGGKDATLVHILTHGVFKAGLFLIAGVVLHMAHKHRHEAHTIGSMHWMKGLGRFYPILRFSAILLLMGLSGVPLSAGFLSKEWTLDVLLYSLNQGYATYLLRIPVLLVPVLTAWYSMKLYLAVFHPYKSIDVNPLGSRERFKVMEFITLTLAILSLFPLVSLHPLRFVIGYDWLSISPVPTIGLSTFILSLSLVGIGWGISLVENKFYTATLSQISDISKKSAWWMKLSMSIGPRLYHAEHHIDLGITNGLLNPLKSAAKSLNKADQQGIDGFIRLLTTSKVVLSAISDWVDRGIVDSFIGASTQAIVALGPRTAEVKGGQIQQYLGRVAIVLLIGLAIIALFIFI